MFKVLKVFKVFLVWCSVNTVHRIMTQEKHLIHPVRHLITLFFDALEHGVSGIVVVCLSVCPSQMYCG